MRGLVFLGPAGAGKGTQAKLLCNATGWEHISTGDMLREECKKDTPFSEKLRNTLVAGDLAEDVDMIELLRQRLKYMNGRGFILDGFPRTFVQAEMLKSVEFTLAKVVYFKLGLEGMKTRLLGRLTCFDCGSTYHDFYSSPKKESECDDCGGKLVKRPDDTLEVIEERYKIFKKHTKPLVEYYGDRVLKIDARDYPEDIANVIRGHMGNGTEVKSSATDISA